MIGQNLDYARALARFSYDYLHREVPHATGRSDNAFHEMFAGQAGRWGSAVRRPRLALVEMAQYERVDQFGTVQTIVQPRLLGKTAVIEWAVRQSVRSQV